MVALLVKIPKAFGTEICAGCGYVLEIVGTLASKKKEASILGAFILIYSSFKATSCFIIVFFLSFIYGYKILQVYFHNSFFIECICWQAKCTTASIRFCQTNFYAATEQRFAVH